MSSDLLSRVVRDPAVCFGRPTIRGHRIWVTLVLGYLAGGWTIDAIVEEFPGLAADDVRACLAYAAQLVDSSVVEIDDP
ncbi:MAG: DUF433 domain-containing protein [Acidimicrobiia bacterium]